MNFTINRRPPPWIIWVMGLTHNMGTILANRISPSLEIVHWPPPVRFRTDVVISGKVIPMKNFLHGCKYSTGEDLTLLGARDAIATASLRECTMCAASLATIDEFYIISRIY